MTAIAFAMNEEFSPVLKKQLVANKCYFGLVILLTTNIPPGILQF